MNSSPASRFLYGAHVHANGIRQHYLRYGGGGDPLVVIPGITSPAITWGFVGERLGQKYDTYILDTRGRGLSASPGNADYSLDAYAKDVAALGDALQLPPFHLIGHSMGGRAAARMALLYPGHLQRVVLIDPPLSGPGRRPYVRDLTFYLQSIHQARKGLLTVEQVRRTYPGWTEEQLHQRVEWLHTCDDTAVAMSLRSFNEEEIHPDLASIRLPTLLLAAGKGGVILDAELAEVRALAPSIQIERIQQCGHLIPFDDLDFFVKSVDRFLG
jgi:N-formylmaleamate deformylase